MKKKKSAASSPPGQLVRRSESDIRKYAKSDSARKAAAQVREHLARHGGEPSPADLTEVPALSDEQLAAMRPVKEQLTIRIDADIVHWLKSKHGPYQTRLNAILRAVMTHERNAPVARQAAGKTGHK